MTFFQSQLVEQKHITRPPTQRRGYRPRRRRLPRRDGNDLRLPARHHLRYPVQPGPRRQEVQGKLYNNHIFPTCIVAGLFKHITLISGCHDELLD